MAEDPDPGAERPPYEVGYGKPPKASQFKRGESGNPAGKTPGRRSFRKLVASELNRRITVNKDGRSSRMALFDVVVRRWVEDAARGDSKAREQLLRLLGQIEAENAGATEAVDREEDGQILARFRARLAAEIRGGDHE